MGSRGRAGREMVVESSRSQPAQIVCPVGKGKPWKAFKCQIARIHIYQKRYFFKRSLNESV